MAYDYESLIPSAHRGRRKFTAMVKITAGAFGSLFDAVQTIPAKFDLDSAVGNQLDIIGEWLGQDRYVPRVLPVFFGFVDSVAARPLGEEGDEAVGGRFYGEGEAYITSVALSDPAYRIFLKALRLKNHGSGSTADLVAAISDLLQTTVTLDDPGNMVVTATVGRVLLPEEVVLLTHGNVLPKPSGVKVVFA